MEKIININFQGRVIPIEETAYNSLKQYTDSLRVHFASEESGDEIINDIENRIAELLGDRLKRGAPCIMDTDVNDVINNIGRLEDIAAEEAEGNTPPKDTYRQQPNAAPQPQYRERFYRNADDKVIAGVCSGIARRMGIDPVVVRIIFVLLFGALFTIYILLWIIVPSKSVQTNVTRRLYRNPDEKAIAGVCSGLAVYFGVSTWIVRLIFIFPLVVGVITRSVYDTLWSWNIGAGPHIFIGSFGGSLFILYVILWIALPYPSSTADRLEMRGEKIDLNSIRAASQANMSAPVRRRSGIGRVIGIIFKAFALFIAGVTAIGLFGALIAIVCASSFVAPFSHFFMDGWMQYALAWASIVLVFGIPLLALATWLVRRIVGARSHRHYLGYVFGGLWIIGIICFAVLVSVMIRDFRAKAIVDEMQVIQQPSTGKLYISAAGARHNWTYHHHSRWFRDWDAQSAWPMSNDSFWLNTVKVEVDQSDDSLFHISATRISRGTSQEEARRLASHISFAIAQQDSIINLPAGFYINSKDKFRNQQVLVTVEVPMGKTVEFNKDIHSYNWFNINVDSRNFNIESDDDDDDYRSGREYKMTASGLKSPKDTLDEDKDDDD